MKLDIIWVIVCILGVIYLFTSDLFKIITNLKIRLKVKSKRKSIIQMKVTNKDYINGDTKLIGGNRIPSKLPDSYIIELEYMDLIHKINDKELFEKLKIGDIIEVTLIEKLDKDKNVLSYLVELNN